MSVSGRKTGVPQEILQLGNRVRLHWVQAHAGSATVLESATGERRFDPVRQKQSGLLEKYHRLIRKRPV